MRVYQIENLGRVVRPLCVGPVAAGVAIKEMPLMGLGAFGQLPRRARPQLRSMRGFWDGWFDGDDDASDIDGPVKANTWGEDVGDAFQDEYDEQVDRLGKDAVAKGGTKVVYDVQVRLVERGGALTKYGVDGKWGAESQAAWNSVMGVPVTRAAVSGLVGYDYTGPMSVFGVSEGGGGGGVPETPPAPPPQEKETDWGTYALIGGAAIVVGGIAYYMTKGRR